MSWAYLIAGIILEVAGTISLKLSHGFVRTGTSIVTVLLFAGSVIALATALKQMPASVAYAVWSALGTTLVAAIGIIWFNEPATAGRVLSIGLIIAGVVWLNLGK